MVFEWEIGKRVKAKRVKAKWKLMIAWNVEYVNVEWE
jgi:hypothetical protein